MKQSHIVLVAALVAIIASYATVKIATPHIAAPVAAVETKKESVYDRVMRTGVINCGYFTWPPFLMKDPNTQEFSGVFYDITEKMAKALSLKINWAMEIGTGDFANALQTGKIDMVCAPISYNASRARVADFAGVLAYTGYYAYARADDERFKDGDLSRIDRDDVTISVLDGEFGVLIAQSRFPNAKTNQIQQLAGNGQMYQNVVDKKADVVFSDITSMEDFQKNNPLTPLARIGTAPVVTVSITYPVKQNEYQFAQMINWAVNELYDTGQVNAVFNKYGLPPDILFRRQKPYQFGAQ